MSKWIAIGDIHGRDTWQQIVNLEIDNVDKIIFVGDYFDSFNIPPGVQISNFKNILELKRSYPDKVVLLAGNHDFHYIQHIGVNERYSGYNHSFSFFIGDECINPAFNERSLKLCYIDNNILFTHAGVTKTWLKNNQIELNDDLDTTLNDLFFHKPQYFKFQSGNRLSRNAYGDDIFQGPLWVRPNSLYADKIDGYIQVVGHTERKDSTIQFENDVYLIDALEKGYYLKFDGETIEIKQLDSVSSP